MKSKITKYLSSFILDFAIIFSLTYFIAKALDFLIIVDYLTLYVLMCIISLFYFLIFYYYKYTTIGKYLFNININLSDQNKLRTLLIREIIIKFTFSIIPFVFFKYYASSFIIAFRYTIIFLVGYVVIFIVKLFFIKFKNKSTFDSLIKVKYSFGLIKNRNNKYFIYLFFYFFIFLIIIGVNNLTSKSKFSFLGITLPQNFPIYPYKIPSDYSEFVKKQIDAKDYIFKLFEEKDIVVLCEPNHLEINNWEFITDLVTDNRFINKIGNVFTEYGAINQQIVLDSFLINKHENVELEASKITDYFNKGFFNYLVNLNKLNITLPDSLKIKHFFCDIDGIQDFNKYELNEFEYRNRDSLLAQVIIKNYNTFKKGRKKCLVITNYRHAYNLNKDIPENETEFIFKSFPKKTANVLLNSYAMNMFFIYYPILYGKWDKVLSINKKQIGFNLCNSPFGEEEFDHFIKFKEGIKYKDVFSGFIFTYSLKDWILNNYIPFQKESSSITGYYLLSVYNLIKLILPIFLNFISLIIILLILLIRRFKIFKY